jgi:hypothetical protein
MPVDAMIGVSLPATALFVGAPIGHFAPLSRSHLARASC